MADLVLVVEDDELLRSAIVAHLSAAGVRTAEADDGAAALESIAQTRFDLVLLDRSMARLDGMAVLKTLRARGVRTPVMFLTAAGDLDERVRGLDAGADDYLSKPFEPAELIARVRALLRRPAALDADILEGSGIRLDRTARRAFVGDTEVTLTAQDFELLETLVRHPGRTFSRENLQQRIGVSGDAALTAVEHAVSRLRRKLHATAGCDVIETVRGAGYRLRRGD